MPQFEYPCPDCRTTSSIHQHDCEFEGTERISIEKAYTDILSTLTRGKKSRSELCSEIHGDWSNLHSSALGLLIGVNRVEVEDEKEEKLRLLTAEEYREKVSKPTVEPVKTIYEHGSVPGCHDNAVFAMVAWYEMVGLSWDETKEKVIEWLHESGSWDRGGFEESSPEELVGNKKHVYDEGYGWKQAGKEAKSVIENGR